MRQQHVEMPLGHRNIAGLAGDEPGVMQGRQRVGQFHQTVEIVERAVATPALQVAYERRTVNRREYLMRPANAYRPRRIAGHLRELRRSTGQQATHQFGGRADAGARDFGARFPPAPQGLRVVAELDTGLLQQPESLTFNTRQRLVIQQGVMRNPAGDIGRRERRCRARLAGTA